MPLSKILRSFSDIVASFEVLRFEVEGDDSAWQLEITLDDGSKLYVRDYIFAGQRRKYAYHWQDSHGRLLVRWDNAPHWPQVETHPHHKHIREERNVHPSAETDLEEVLSAIRAQIRGG